MTIEVTRLDRTLVFEDREALARRVEEIIENRGGIFAPMELACIQRLAELSNGDAPPAVSRITRKSRYYVPPKPERPADPAEEAFDARIEELADALEARQAEHDALDAEIREKERRYEAEYRRRIKEADRNPTKMLSANRWREARQHELTELRGDREALHEAARRARVQRNALLLRRDRWRADRAARFMIDGDVVTLEELHERLAERDER